MNYKEDEDKFRDLLNNEYQWPTIYTFKFIVGKGEEEQIVQLFEKDANIQYKPSSGGKYISTSIQVVMESANQIISIYQQAAKIKGIISL